MLLVVYVMNRLTPWLPKVSLLITLLVPGVLLALLGGVYRDHLLTQESAVRSSDCTAYEEKRDLQHAYAIGTEVLTACAAESGGITYVDTIENCGQFKEASKGYEGELSYLKGLEGRFPCAGFCAGGSCLFEFPGMSAKSCDIFVLEQLRGSRMQSTVVMWYAIVIVIISVPLYLFAGPLLD